jgi:hypothetical protein
MNLTHQTLELNISAISWIYTAAQKEKPRKHLPCDG